MTRDARFWRNVTIIALIHVALLLGLLWWSRSSRQQAKDIVWMEGGAGAAAGAESMAATAGSHAGNDARSDTERRGTTDARGQADGEK